MAIETNDLIDVQTLSPFKKFIMTIGALPTSYLESMTYAELLMWFCNYLQETVIPTVNNNGLAVEELQNLYEQMVSYVNNYFDNLNVQNEINNKLDDMAQDGTLSILIGSYIDPLIAQQNSNINSFKQGITNEISVINAKVESATSGSPLVASSTSGMTDTTRTYVNTTDGYWYYYNGTTWVQGGVYQASVDPDDIEDLRDDLNYLATILPEETEYNGTWWVGDTTLHTASDWHTIRYKIPEYLTNFYVDTNYYGLNRIFIADIEDPTETAFVSTNSLRYPSSNFAEMTHVQQTFDLTQSKQYKYVYVPYYVPYGKPTVKGYNTSSLTKLQNETESNKQSIDSLPNLLPLKLTASATYQGYWTGTASAMQSSTDWPTYKFEIPKGVTKLYIKSEFYGNMSIYFTDIADPTQTGMLKDSTAYAIPYNYYNTLVEREQVITLDRYYKYVYVPSYVQWGVPTVIAYKGSALDKAWNQNNPLAGKKILIFGDSITYVPLRWRSTFFKITRAEELACISYPGAHLADYSINVPLDGDYTNDSDGGVHNTVCNQVYYWLNNATDDQVPDIIIISAGTNDYYTSPEQLATDVNVYANTSGWINVDAINRTTFEGAMRWITSKLRTKYPNAIIVFASPIQSAQDIGESKSIDVFIAKEQKMQRACNHLSAKLIKATTESGITGEFEANGVNGRYLIDGLHPNDNGGNVLGTYYAQALTDMLIVENDWDKYV